MPRPQPHSPGCYRCPAHVPPQYVLLLLEIVLTIVSGKGGANASKYSISNREDVVLARGCVLLSTYIGSVTSKFALLSLQILAHVSKTTSSWRPMLESGCINSILRYITYLRDTGKLYWMPKGSDGLHTMRDKSQEEQLQHQVYKFAFFDCLLTLTKIAIHSAGVYKAVGAKGT